MNNSEKIERLESQVRELQFELKELRKTLGIKEIKIYEYCQTDYDDWANWCNSGVINANLEIINTI